MFINFGSYTKKIKTFSYKELEVSDDYKDVEFQLHQKIAHIYFIPLVPLDKSWIVKNTITDQEVSVTDDVYKKLIKTKNRIRSPFWTYTGGIILGTPVVLVIGFLVFLLLSSIFSELTYSTKKGIESIEKRIEHNKENDKTLNLIENPIIGDIYDLNVLELIMKKNQNGKKIGFKKGDRENYRYKVITIQGQTITLKKIDNPTYTDIEIILKDTATLTIEELISVSDNFKTLPLYDGIKNSLNENMSEAVFSVKEIIREE